MRGAMLLGTAGLMALAGCATKKRDLPPPPPPVSSATTQPAAPGAGTGAASGGVGSTGVPGGRENFRDVVGSDQVLFGVDSYELDDEAKTLLVAQAGWLQRNPQVRVTLEGHCDERGSREYNLALGERRANAAKTFLAAQGVDAGRMSVISYGKERPASEGSDDEAYAQNRRAVTVVPG